MRGLTLFSIVAALIELSKFRLPTITSTLLGLLDSIKVCILIYLIYSYTDIQ